MTKCSAECDERVGMWNVGIETIFQKLAGSWRYTINQFQYNGSSKKGIQQSLSGLGSQNNLFGQFLMTT